MPIIIATLNFPPMTGGIENLTREIARGLVEHGRRVRVLAPRWPGDDQHDRGEPYEVKRFVGGRMRHFGLTAAVQRELSAGAQTLLFMQWTGATMIAAARTIHGRPQTMAVVCHGKDLLMAEHGYRSTLAWKHAMRCVLRQAQHAFAVSRFTASLVRGCGVDPAAIHVINPGVDTQTYHARPHATLPDAWRDGDGPYLLSLTRLVPRKGVDTVIAALASVRRRHPGVRYLVGGDGPDRPRLQALAREHGVADIVRFLGRVDDDALPRLYAAVDLMVMVSRQEDQTGDVEGFGLVLLEAQACGTAVIAGDSGGMPDALVPGETGMLVPPADPAALARTLEDLLGDRDRLRRMGHAAAAHAGTRTWSRVASIVATALPQD